MLGAHAVSVGSDPMVCATWSVLCVGLPDFQHSAVLFLHRCTRTFSSPCRISHLQKLNVNSHLQRRMSFGLCVVSCSQMEVFWHFRGMYCLLGGGAVRETYHFTSTRLHGAASQKTAIFTDTALRNVNFTCTVSSKLLYYQMPVFTGLLSHGWEDNIKKDCKEIQLRDVDVFHWVRICVNDVLLWFVWVRFG